MPNHLLGHIVLVVDIGGTHVKLLVSGAEQSHEFESNAGLTPGKMVDRIRGTVDDWEFDRVAVGYPGPVLH